MNRGQFIAIFVGLFAAGGLALSALSGGEDDVVTAVAASSGNSNDAVDSADADTTSDDAGSESAEAEEPVEVWVPENFGPAGTLTDLDGWLQTDATAFEDFDGEVKIVQFWTFGCINCKNTLVQIGSLYDNYGPDGLEVIGVHTPEFDFEKDPDAIAEAAINLNVTWPIALDTDKTNFRAWQEGRRFWPRTYVVDANGDIRYDKIGEFGGNSFEELDATIDYLLSNGGS